MNFLYVKKRANLNYLNTVKLYKLTFFNYSNLNDFYVFKACKIKFYLKIKSLKI